MTIKQSLINAGIYQEKLDHQILLAQKLKAECNTLREEIKNTGYLIDGAKGKVANPLIASLQKAESLLQSAYSSLGLTYSIKPENIQAKPKEEGDKIAELLDL